MINQHIKDLKNKAVEHINSDKPLSKLCEELGITKLELNDIREDHRSFKKALADAARDRAIKIIYKHFIKKDTCRKHGNKEDLKCCHELLKHNQSSGLIKFYIDSF